MNIFTLSSHKVDLDRLRVDHPDGSHALSTLEGTLLAHLRGAAGAAVSKETLLEHVWGYSSKARTRTVDTTVRRLRVKLEADPANPTHLLTVRGEGIQLVGVLEVTTPDLPFIGREAESARVRSVTVGCPLSIVGVRGVGKSALARHALPEAHVVDADGCTTEDALLARIGDGTLLDLQRTLKRAGRVLLLDGVSPGVLSSQTASALAAATPMVITSTAPTHAERERLVHLDLLPESDRRDLLRALLEREGRATGDLSAASNPLTPRELVRHATTSARTPERPALDASQAALLAEISVFEGTFPVAAAIQVSIQGRAAVLSGLQRLVRAGLLTPLSGAFRVLRDARSLPPQTARRAHAAYLAGLIDTPLIDGGQRFLALGDDVVQAVGHLDQPTHAPSLAMILADLIMLSHDAAPLVPHLEALADRFPTPLTDVRRASIFHRAGHAPPDWLERCRTLARAGCSEAAIHVSRFSPEAEAVHWRTMALEGDGQPALFARYGNWFVGVPDHWERVRELVWPAARQQEWAWILDAFPRAHFGHLVTHGRFEEARTLKPPEPGQSTLPHCVLFALWEGALTEATLLTRRYYALRPDGDACIGWINALATQGPLPALPNTDVGRSLHRIARGIDDGEVLAEHRHILERSRVVGGQTHTLTTAALGLAVQRGWLPRWGKADEPST